MNRRRAKSREQVDQMPKAEPREVRIAVNRGDDPAAAARVLEILRRILARHERR